MEQPIQKRITVIGAGFSGLVVSYYLNKLGFAVEIYEQGNQAGGLISTRKTKFGLVESAANGLLNCAELEDLCAEIGVELIRTKKVAKSRFILRNGKLRRWPLTAGETLKFLRFLKNYYFNRSSVEPRSSESLSDWGARVLGSLGSQYTIETASLGIYGSNPNHLSAKLILKKFFSPNQVKPQTPKLGRGTVAPANGMGELIERLRKFLEQKGVRFYFNTEVKSKSDLPKSDHLVIATSAIAACRLLRMFGDKREETLSLVKMLPVTSATFFLKSTGAHVKGFGCLFPRRENISALGVLFNNYIFENRCPEFESETWILPEANQAEDYFKNLVLSERQRIFTDQPDLKDYFITRWPEALPCYDSKLENFTKEKVTERGVSLIGNYLGEIGLRQILLRAKTLASEISQELK